MRDDTEQGASQAHIRQHNRVLALAAVAQHGRLTRAALSDSMRLTKPAVSRIATELITAGLLTETAAEASSRRGRPTTYLTLSTGRHLFVAVDVRVDGLLVQARDLSGAVLAESRHALPRTLGADRSVELISGQIEALCTDLGRRPDGIGLAVGAGVDPAGRMITSSPYRPWRDVPLPELIKERLGYDPGPVAMRDVSTCAALGNWQEIAADPLVTSLAHIQIGIGAGGGLVRRGATLPRVSSLTISHLPMQADGPPCACGARGCLDAVAGFDALVRHAEPTGLRPRQGARMLERYCAALLRLADDGDPAARRAITETAGWFARAAAMVINIVRPDRITYGGYPLLLGPLFRERFLAVAGDHAPAVSTQLTETRVGDGASVTGAFWLALGEFLAEPFPVGTLA
ncbi:ROK family transcriptional regulator [Microlunatus sp. GCM10028923]|uniref:ROK family transcriptional regulator n=1 Tax=Microlunatus sp. GCM10028923 TaxID=3273400 RepID=UPI0036205EF6